MYIVSQSEEAWINTDNMESLSAVPNGDGTCKVIADGVCLGVYGTLGRGSQVISEVLEISCKNDMDRIYGPRSQRQTGNTLQKLAYKEFFAAHVFFMPQE